MVRTVVTREPEWDDQQRNLMLALAQFESELCDCGNHISVLDDPENNVFMPSERVCAVCASMDQYHRIQHARDEAADKNRSENAPPETSRPADGRKTHLRPVPPNEVAAARARKSVAQKPPGDQGKSSED